MAYFWLDWRRGGIVFASTLSVFLAVALGGVLLAELSWPFALLLAATASLWGAFTGVPAERLRYVLQVGVVGGCLSLIILSVVLLWAAAEGTVQTDAISFVGRLTLSLVIGAVSAAIVRFFAPAPERARFTRWSIGDLFSAACCLKWFRYPSYLWVCCWLGPCAACSMAPSSSLYTTPRGICAAPVLFCTSGGVLNVRLLNAPAPDLLMVFLITVGALLLLRGVFTYDILALGGRGPVSRLGMAAIAARSAAV